MNACTLKENYDNKFKLELRDDLGLKNVMLIPELQKITLNSSLSYKNYEEKKLKHIQDKLTLISGQKCVIRNAKKSVSSFNLRKGMPTSVTVTLRREKMYFFLDKLINIVLPRVRDFSFFSCKSFDKFNNLNIGIADHSIFPEIPFDEVFFNWGFDVNIVMKSLSVEHSFALLKKINFPIRY